MSWIIYFAVSAIIMLVPFTAVAVISNRTEVVFFDKNLSSIAKGIGILCVMLCHFMGIFGKGTVFFTPLGGIGVTIFLILSGYGLSESWSRGGVFVLVEKKNTCCCHTICFDRNCLLLAVS